MDRQVVSTTFVDRDRPFVDVENVDSVRFVRPFANRGLESVDLEHGSKKRNRLSSNLNNGAVSNDDQQNLRFAAKQIHTILDYAWHQRGVTSDLKFVCGDSVVINAHRLFLSLVNRHIYDVLRSSYESHEDVTTVIIPDISSSDLENALNDIYRRQDVSSFNRIWSNRSDGIKKSDRTISNRIRTITLQPLNETAKSLARMSFSEGVMVTTPLLRSSLPDHAYATKLKEKYKMKKELMRMQGLSKEVQTEYDDFKNLRYQCWFCSSVFKDRFVMSSHLETHKFQFFLCPHCGEKTETDQDMEIHIRTVCDSSFPEMWTNNYTSCLILGCNEVKLTTPRSIYDHYRLQHCSFTMETSCALCSKSNDFYSSTIWNSCHLLVDHYGIRDKFYWTCPLDADKFKVTKLNHHKEHWQTKHLGLKYRCLLCQIYFDCKKQLKSHVSSYHGRNEIIYTDEEDDDYKEEEEERGGGGGRIGEENEENQNVDLVGNLETFILQVVDDDNVDNFSSVSTKIDISCPYCELKLSSQTKLDEHVLVRHPYPCHYCKSGFANKSALNVHEFRDHNLRIFFCELCTSMFDDETEMYLHKFECDPNFPSREELVSAYPIRCRVANCDSETFSFLLTGELNKHYAERHPELTYKKPEMLSSSDFSFNYSCVICKTDMCSKANFTDHWKRKHLGRFYKCGFCKALFGTRKFMRRHLNGIHRVWSSTISSKKSRVENPGNLILDPSIKKSEGGRIEIKDKTEETVCPHCDLRFPSFRLFSAHRRKEHINDAYKCFKCSTMYLSRKDILNHKRECDPDFPVYYLKKELPCKAPECGKMLAGIESCRTHWEIKHMRTMTDFDTCIICFAECKGRKDFLSHVLKTHHSFKYQCRLCDKYYCKDDNLRLHWNVQHLGQVFECAFCRDTFTDLQLINKHLLMVHLSPNYKEEKPICDICGARMEYWESLSKHRKKEHPKNPPVESLLTCQMCGKHFQMEYYLKIHINKVHGIDNRKSS